MLPAQKLGKRSTGRLNRGDRTGLSIIDTGNVVHAACNEENAVRGPGKIVDFGTNRPAHGLYPPRLLVFKPLFEVGVCGVVVGRYPEQDVAVVTRSS
jgi:hypothetical protein